MMTTGELPRVAPQIVEAPPEIIALFRAWWHAGNFLQTSDLMRLQVALWPHRRIWFLVDEYLIHLTPDDRVRVLDRSAPLHLNH